MSYKAGGLAQGVPQEFFCTSFIQVYWAWLSTTSQRWYQEARTSLQESENGVARQNFNNFKQKENC
eukprot:2589291-Ditylum_brightwellii.AAC.1